jgi:hypothetical protein
MDSVKTINPLKKRLAGLLIVVLCASLAAPTLAAAQQTDPTGDQYDPTVTQIQAAGGSGGGSAGSGGLDGNVGPLPFTGFDVIAMVAVALAVTGLGLALQRAVSRERVNHS